MRKDPWPPSLDGIADEDDGPPLQPMPSRITARGLFDLLTEYFGDQKQAFDFMRAFPGLTFHIPQPEITERIAREQHVAKRLKQNPSTDNVRRLSQFYSIPMRVVVKEFQKTTGKSVMSLRPPPPPKLPEAPPAAETPPKPRNRYSWKFSRRS